MKVHRGIGYGFQEVIYQRALRSEMQRAGLSFERECDMPVFYEREQVGTRWIPRSMSYSNPLAGVFP